MTNPFNNLVDEPRDILALFGGIVLTLTMVAAMFILDDLRELIAGSLLTIVVLIYNHFFQKASDGGNEG